MPATGLRTLERRLHARRNEAWLAFTDEWLEREFAELGTLVHSMVRVLMTPEGRVGAHFARAEAIPRASVTRIALFSVRHQ